MQGYFSEPLKVDLTNIELPEGSAAKKGQKLMSDKNSDPLQPVRDVFMSISPSRPDVSSLEFEPFEPLPENPPVTEEIPLWQDITPQKDYYGRLAESFRGLVGQEWRIRVGNYGTFVGKFVRIMDNVICVLNGYWSITSSPPIIIDIFVPVHMIECIYKEYKKDEK